MPSTAQVDETPYAAVVFDLDGTLIDTETLCNAAGLVTCRALGIDITADFFESLAGIHDARRVELISARIGRPVDFDHFMNLWDAECTRGFAKGVPVKPGVAEVMALISARALPVALATSSRRDPARQKLVAAGLAGHFATVVTVEDVARPKPAPDPYLLAAQRLGVDPARCLAFEDSETGAASAHAAGMTVVQIPDLHPASGDHAHYIASDLMTGARAAGLLRS